MWATIYTDASYDSRKGAAGAYYIRSNHSRINLSFKIEDCRDSNIAEAFTIAKAIKHAVELHNSLNITLVGVHVVTDSGAAISIYKYGAKLSKNKALRKLQDMVKDFLLANKLRIKIRHIKGHQRVVDARTYLNNKLDTLAKQANER